MKLWKTATRRATLCLSAAAVLCGAHASSALAFAGTTAAIRGTAGTSLSGTVASFTDGTLLLACANASEYSATVDWGDGSTSSGAVVHTSTALLGSCNYDVTAS
ncbi:MAG TPA: hypothetical protein VHW26_03885, partial [Solirubrobacteraceae bacterium]|nr:hypothetical protein [Solirubrobacteraceae bacterium]